MADISGGWQGVVTQQQANDWRSNSERKNQHLQVTWGCKEAVVCQGEVFLRGISTFVPPLSAQGGGSSDSAQ